MRTDCSGRDYKAAYDTDPENAFAALGYDAVGLIADAIKRAGSDDAKAIRDAIAATNGYVGVTGTISYPNGATRAGEDGDDDRDQGGAAAAGGGGRAELDTRTVAHQRGPWQRDLEFRQARSGASGARVLLGGRGTGPVNEPRATAGAPEAAKPWRNDPSRLRESSRDLSATMAVAHTAPLGARRTEGRFPRRHPPGHLAGRYDPAAASETVFHTQDRIAPLHGQRLP